MWSKLWSWATANKTAIIIVVLCLGVLASAYDSYRHRSMLAEAKKAEKEQTQKIETMEKEAALKDEAFRKAIGATEIPLKNALQGVREAREGVREAKMALSRIESQRSDLWIPPAVDNGDLVARFEKALEAIR